MAANKGKSSRNTRPRRSQFPQFKGKVVERVEVSTMSQDWAIGILFQDRTYLSFDIEMGITILPELSSFKSGEYRPLKRWRAITN
jgi:hypothetical protein